MRRRPCLPYKSNYTHQQRRPKCCGPQPVPRLWRLRVSVSIACGYFKRGINCASLVNMVVIKRCSAFLKCPTTVESARLRFLASCSEFFFLVYHSNPSCRQQQEPNVAFG